MKTKASALFLMAFFLFAAQFSGYGQAADCYDFQCPTNIYSPCEGPWGAHVWYSVTASNRCNPSLPPTVTYSVPPGSIFPPGTNVVCATIQIPGLPPRNCCWQVIIDTCCSSNCIDVICPRDIAVPCQQTPVGWGAMIPLPPPTATNNCGDHTIPPGWNWRSQPPSQPNQPVFFPPGNHRVVWCLIDSQGNIIRCCCFEVAVTNCPPNTSPCVPQIICPTNISMQCEGDRGALVFFPPPKVIDPCGLVIATNVTHPSGSFFPNGKTIVGACITWREPATGQLFTECCCFEVVVRCCPTNCISRLDCPPDMTIPCPGPNGTPLNYTVFGTNTCEPTTVVCDPPPGSIIYGNTNVCCKLLNSSGVSLKDCCFHVLVKDDVPPHIDCPPDMDIFSPDCKPVDVQYPPPAASDDCQLDHVTCTPPSGSPFPVGTTVVTCCAYDTAGNSNCCTFKITVRCDQDCVRLICPDNITNNCAGPNGTVITYTAYATNVCTGGPAPLICTPPSGSFFPLGTTTVCCSNVTAGVVRTCCFTVTVRPDTVPPTIVCPGDITVTSPNCQPMDVQYPPPSASDNCKLDHVTCTPPSGSPFPVGTTVVTCCAFDTAGNSNCCTFKVTVRCEDCTRLICPNNITNVCAGPNGVIVNYNAYVSNTCTGGSVPANCTPPSGSFFPLGTTTVCCTNGPSGTVPQWCCFNVTVRPDTVPPTIVCPGDITVTSPNCQPMDVQYPPPSASDDCKLDHVTCTPPSGSPFPIGVTIVTCCAFDSAGNSNCCTFKVTVRCEDCVTLYCPSNITVNCAGPNGAVVTYSATASNTCTGGLVPLVCTPPSGSNFPIGVTTVCCTNVTAGVVKYCCFDVTVRPDTVPPTITCPPDITVISPNCQPMDVQYPPPTASDDCKLDHVTCTPPSGSLFPLGVTTVKCCAYDAAGNSNCCTFKVTVRCEDCTRLVCPSNIVYECAGPNGAVINYNAYVSNTCTGGTAPANCTPPSGSFFPIGVTTVCCTNGTAATTIQWCCFEVTVRRDTVPPVINCPSNIYILCAKPNGQKVNYTVTATDNCTAAPTITCVPPSGSQFPIGCTPVTCVATDAAGNSSTCTFKICLLAQGCYLINPSFEQLVPPPLPAPAACGDPIALAQAWSALSGTPDLWRPPFASLAPGNCRGRENPCDGTNYAGLEGGYTSTGVFNTEEMMGTLVAPLNNGKSFRLRACLSLAESSPGPVLIEFVLANSANLAQQQVIAQTWVQQVNGWKQFLPPCFDVPTQGNWDRLIIRMAKVPVGSHTYQVGYAYVDNVNICCCKPILHTPVLNPTTVTVRWEGRGQLEATGRLLDDGSVWHDVTTPVSYDPETDTYSTEVPRDEEHIFFRVAGSGGTVGCSECGM